MFLAEKEAKKAIAKRKPRLPSKYYVQSFLSAFHEDPVEELEVLSDALYVLSMTPLKGKKKR